MLTRLMHGRFASFLAGVVLLVGLFALSGAVPASAHSTYSSLTTFHLVSTKTQTDTQAGAAVTFQTQKNALGQERVVYRLHILDTTPPVVPTVTPPKPLTKTDYKKVPHGPIKNVPNVTACYRTQCDGIYPGDVFQCNSSVIGQTTIPNVAGNKTDLIEVRYCRASKAAYATVKCTGFTGLFDTDDYIDQTRNLSENRGPVSCTSINQYLDSRVLGVQFAAGDEVYGAYEVDGTFTTYFLPTDFPFDLYLLN